MNDHYLLGHRLISLIAFCLQKYHICHERRKLLSHLFYENLMDTCLLPKKRQLLNELKKNI